jgi:hypothetical protein
MSAVCMPHKEDRRVKAARGLARLLPSTPDLVLHPVSSAQRSIVEQYVFNQFQTNHGATVRDFMPLLFTMNCHDEFTSAVGIRPASGYDLFLEQYLQEPVENVLSGLSANPVNRGEIVEAGNLVATQRGSSQLIYLVMAMILQRAGFKWLVITATPQVQKTIKRLGFELYTLADADPSVLDTGSLNGWGSYYENQPCVVAGNLAEAMSVLADRSIYTRLISRYQTRIDALALAVRQTCYRDGRRSHAA